MKKKTQKIQTLLILLILICSFLIPTINIVSSGETNDITITPDPVHGSKAINFTINGTWTNATIAHSAGKTFTVKMFAKYNDTWINYYTTAPGQTNGTFSVECGYFNYRGRFCEWAVNVTDSSNDYKNESFVFWSHDYFTNVSWTTNNNLNSATIENYTVGATPPNGSAFARRDHEYMNKCSIWDEYNDCWYIFWLNNASQEGWAHVTISVFYPHNNSYDTRTKILGQSLVPYGTSWCSSHDGNQVSENHWRAHVQLDKYEHICLFFGGHATATYPMQLTRTNVNLSNFNWTDSSHWTKKSLFWSGSGGCYHTDLAALWGKHAGTLATLYRCGSADTGPMNVAYSTDNGSIWTNVSINDEAFYGIRGWHYDPVIKDYVLLAGPREWGGDSSRDFYWTTLDDIINGNGGYASNQSYGDTPYYSFQFAGDEIIPLDTDIGEGASNGALEYNPYTGRVYLAKRNNSLHGFFTKILGTEDSWIRYDFNVTTWDNMSNFTMTDFKLINNGSLFVVSGLYNDQPVYLYSDTPLINNSWNQVNLSTDTWPDHDNVRINFEQANNSRLVWWEGNSIYGSCDNTGCGSNPKQAYFTYLNDQFNPPAPAEGDVNKGPTLTVNAPANGSTGIELNPSINITFNDEEGDQINLSIWQNNSGPWEQSLLMTGTAGNQTITGVLLNASVLSTKYWWSVNYSHYDGTNSTTEIFHFTTRGNTAPAFTNQNPANESIDVSLSTTFISINISDVDGDTFNWTIETSPHIGSDLMDYDTNGTKYCTVSGLLASTTYTWYVNATDGFVWNNETYTFNTTNKNTTILRVTYDTQGKTVVNINTISIVMTAVLAIVMIAAMVIGSWRKKNV